MTTSPDPVLTSEGSRAVGLLDEAERDAVLAALDAVETELADDTFMFVESDEDLHTAVERRVTELAGAAGAKLHTARSRNDQVATDLRLWCKRELSAIASKTRCCNTCVRAAPRPTGQPICPDTRTSNVPSRCSSPIICSRTDGRCARDVDRLLATIARLDVSPLGAGALAGTSLPIDPALAAGDLGFAKAFDNSLDAVSDRDFVAEALFDLALLGIHLSRIGEEFVLWTSAEFGFARLE